MQLLTYLIPRLNRRGGPELGFFSSTDRSWNTLYLEPDNLFFFYRSLSCHFQWYENDENLEWYLKRTWQSKAEPDAEGFQTWSKGQKPNYVKCQRDHCILGVVFSMGLWAFSLPSCRTNRESSAGFFKLSTKFGFETNLMQNWTLF